LTNSHVVQCATGITVSLSRPVDRRLARHLGLSGERAVEIVNVEANTPAAIAGLETGGLIVGIDSRPIETVAMCIESSVQKRSAVRSR